MILAGGVIQFPIIYANTPSRNCTSGNQFIVIIQNYHHSTIVWRIMSGAHPRTVRDLVNYPASKNFFTFFFTTSIMFGFSLH